MPKITGPLFSEKASGTVQTVLTFSNKRTGQQVRYQKKQKDFESVPQLDQRNKFQLASLSCRLMDYGVAIAGVSSFGVDDIFYTEKAKNKNVTGYNLCISDYLLINS
jgi:hypothetical protein